MDPFEVRIRFTQQLASLNASVTGASKTAQYALKYRDLDEDLHSCILEQLERVGSFQLVYLHEDFPEIRCVVGMNGRYREDRGGYRRASKMGTRKMLTRTSQETQ